MTKEELYEFIKNELKGCPNYAFIDHSLAELDANIRRHPLFDPLKFKEWFVDRNVIYKNNPLAFLVKCGKEDLDDGLFDREQISGFAMHVFMQQLKNSKIEVADKNDGLRIELIELHLVNSGYMDLDALRYWNRSAMDYLKNKKKTTKDFIALFAISKATRDAVIPYDEIEERVQEIGVKWEEAMSNMVGMVEPPHGNEVKESETNNDKNKEEKTNN